MKSVNISISVVWLNPTEESPLWSKVSNERRLWLALTVQPLTDLPILPLPLSSLQFQASKLSTMFETIGIQGTDGPEDRPTNPSR